MYWLVIGGILLLFLFMYNHYQFNQAEQKFPASGKFVSVDGIRLHYYTTGREGDPPVVFLHGGLLSGNDFRHVMEQAAVQGYQAFAFDRPGYGYSERPKQAEPEEQARLIRDALIALGVERPVLVGHSWSGLLVLAYALQYPDELAGVVSLGGGMYKEGYPAAKGDVISAAVTTPMIGPTILRTMLAVVGPVLSDRILTATFAPEEVPQDYRLEARALWLRPEHFRANREDVLQFLPAVTRLSDKYNQISLPLVIAVGADDPFDTREHSSRLHQEVSHSQLLVWEGIAHMIPQLHPSLVWDAVAKITN
ncbi:alpha/beta fold hydrolase [Paenibacillus daejeonensis]|uniref:alpha/beta fold hydrolase n=1 Tax=Paenibacillus daejeonensis TaxID=135193 RepID=UPI000363C749|nr:alpha/beta hydrolase [Paenibacillus daejeonensis]